MRAVLRFIINLALIIGVVWLLMKFTPVGPWVRGLIDKHTSTDISINTGTTGNQQGHIDPSVCSTPWGTKIPNGSTVFAYKSTTPSSNGTCEEEIRTCTDGLLDGSYTYSSCGKAPTGSTSTGSNSTTEMTLAPTGKSCTTPWGEKISHGDYIVSYESPASCRFQRRMCVDGQLLGKFQYNYCILPAYNGTTQGSNQATISAVDYQTAYEYSNQVNDESPYANNAYYDAGNYPTSTVYYGGNNENKQLPNDNFNQNVKGNVAVVSSSSTWTSWNGNKTNPYATDGDSVYQTPKDWKKNYVDYDLTMKGCQTPWGTHVDHGQYVLAYRVANPASGRSCEYERRSCNYGKLSGTFTNPSCTIKGKTYTQESELLGNKGYDEYYWVEPKPTQTKRSCTLPRGGTIADGATVRAYQKSSSPWTEGCVGEIRTCHDGVLDGSYSNRTCTFTNTTPPPAPTYASCSLPWGGSIAHGQKVLAFAQGVSSTCDREWRTCNNGQLAGNYTYQDCQAPQNVEQPPVTYASCSLPWGGTIVHGQSVTAFAQETATSCVRETRICNNGSLGGSYGYKNCSVSTPTPQPPVTYASCSLPRGGSIAHGQSVTAYLTEQVPLLASCIKETRTCNNGVLSGKGYAKQTCEVVPPPVPPVPDIPKPPVPKWIPDWLVPPGLR